MPRGVYDHKSKGGGAAAGTARAFALQKESVESVAQAQRSLLSR